LDFSAYDAVWLNFCSRRSYRSYDATPILRAVANYDGLKLVSMQDEYDYTNEGRDMLIGVGADIVLTCVPKEHAARVYDGVEAQFEAILTGYVSDDLLQHASPPVFLADRDIAVGYRGRECPYRLGEIGWHKTEIGKRFKEACVRRGVVHNIESDEGSRIYGDEWFTFLKRCRVTLGCESGSNVFDHDNSLFELIKGRWEKNKNIKYEDCRDEVAARQCDFHMGQIGPRHLEMAAMKTAMVLVRGHYSGLLKAGEHYITVEPDYSNVDDVLDQIEDLPTLEKITHRAFWDIARNEGIHYRGFIAGVDDLVDQATERERISKLPVTTAPLGADPYLLRIMGEIVAQHKKIDEYLQGLTDAGFCIVRNGEDYSIARRPN